MKNKTYIHIADVCRGHGLERTFLYRLREYELIEIRETDSGEVIDHGQLPRLERLIRLHRDLEIEPQGLLAVEQLLQRVGELQDEIRMLRSRLGRWEDF